MQARIKWSEICLIILDECHNAVKLHPMALIMKDYCKAIKDGGIVDKTVPRVLGLTATIIKGMGKLSKEFICEEVSDIEKKFHAVAVTHSNYEEVLR
jgi:ERCC4-related helicase